MTGWSSAPATAATCAPSIADNVLGVISGSNSGCYLGTDNVDSLAQVNLDAMGGINTWSLVVPNTDTNATNSINGNYSLPASDFFLVYNVALLVLKGGTAADPSTFVGYLLTELDGLTGEWISPFVNGKGEVKDISHFTVYGAVSAVPLPAGVALLGAGLGVLGLIGWRKKRPNDRVASVAV
jgi:hypothetical protein